MSVASPALACEVVELPLEVQCMIARALCLLGPREYITALQVCRLWYAEGTRRHWQETMAQIDWTWRQQILGEPPGKVLDITTRRKLSNDTCFTWDQYYCVHKALDVINFYNDRRASLGVISMLHEKSDNLKTQIMSAGLVFCSYGLYILYDHSPLTPEEVKENWGWLEDTFFLVLENQLDAKEKVLESDLPEEKRKELLPLCELRYITKDLHQVIQQSLQKLPPT